MSRKLPWALKCPACGARREAEGLATVCPSCGSPWLVKYDRLPAESCKATLGLAPWSMWRYRPWLPILEDEEPVSLGEGMTPLLRVPALERELGLERVWIKDESQNPTGSFKARGLSAAVTRATASGVTRFTIPTAGNAGVALSAYARMAQATARVFAPADTPPTILQQIRAYGAELVLLNGHIGDCGKASRQYAAESGAFDVSTLREPYRIEGKKTLGLELAEQLGWELPDAVIYPAGGGTGLIGIWKAFGELAGAGWIKSQRARMFAVQSSGCAPVVRAFEAGADRTEEWENPVTVAWGLRVPAPLGGALMLRALRESGGGALAVSDQSLRDAQIELCSRWGIDASPEGGATLAGLRELVRRGEIKRGETVVLFNTGAGWLYR